MKKLLNEFTSAYPTSISNSHSQEYTGALSPIDAEAVQANDMLHAKTSDGLHRINAFIKHFFRRTTLDPRNEVNQLRSRLNHLNLDFTFDKNVQLEEVNNFTVTEGGNAFGTTPTTDLSKGFDTGSDLPQYNLEIRVLKTDNGYKLEGKMTPKNAVTESMIKKSKRNDRLSAFKNFLKKK